MTKVYHQSKGLIILERLFLSPDDRHFQNRIITAVGGGIQTIYEAHEIWFYNAHNKRFEYYKNRSIDYASTDEANTLLQAYLLSRNIHIQHSAANMTNGLPSWYRFVDDKDLFLFKLSF